MLNNRVRLALGMAASLGLLHCSGEVIEFRRHDGGTGDGTCAPVNRGEPMDGLPCSGSELRSNDCQVCQCHAGKLKCSEYICRDDQCPTRPPAPGGACATAGCSCEYPNACGTPHVARCVQGQWSVEYAQCAPECPATIPKDGSSCWDLLARCDYGMEAHASCLGGTAGSGNDSIAGTWMVFNENTEPGAGACPKTQPAEGASCTGKELTCLYQNECGAVDVVRCSDSWGGEWSNSRESQCWSGCPAEQPQTGDPCDTPLLVGPECSYAHGTSCLTRCFCKSDRRYACYERCASNHDAPLGSGYPPPGAVPPPWSQCSEHVWCPEIGTSCGNGCSCTAQGWDCN